MKGLCCHFGKIYVLNIWIFQDVNEFWYDYFFLKNFLSGVFMQGYVYNNSNWIEN